MGDTKGKQLHRGFKLTRIITAALTGVFFVIAFSQLLFFQNIKVYFQTGVDAQQIETIKMKKGSNVELPTPLKPGSYFLGWSLSPNSAEILQDSTGLMQDTTLYAVWDGAEKYAVLSVCGVNFKEVNIFDTSVDGLTANDLNQNWRVLDDYAKDNQNLVDYSGYKIDPNNNFSRFLGWQYLNANNTYNDLLYTPDATGKAGTWTWVQRDENGNTIKTIEINDTNKFYPPNYRTTFTALLDYRVINIRLYDQGQNNCYATLTFKLGEENVTLPVFTNNPSAHFSHWQIRAGFLKNYANADEKPELAALLSQVKKRYEAGETLDVLDPLWYYYANDLRAPNNRTEPQVYLNLDAVYWDDTSVYHYTVQPFTDLNSGTEYQNFGDVDYSNLSVENPVAYDSAGNNIWLYFNQQILSYAFYDHNGVHHVLTTDRFGGHNQSIAIDANGNDIYFKNEWGINIEVNYQSSATNVTVKFEYGDDLYLVPSYYHYNSPVTTTLISKIGNSFEILNSEKYLKPDHIFSGWQIKGDQSGRVYYAGEKFTISNFNTQTQSTVIEFVAVWHIQRLLFDFDFDGGSWHTETGPDFTLMKGGFNQRVRIVSEEPVKFGYDFAGWTLENDTEILYPNDYLVVGTKYQTLHAHWTPRRLRVRFYKKYDNSEVFGPTGDDFIKDVNNETLYSGGVIELLPIKDDSYYSAQGWQIGNQVVDKSVSTYQLTPQVLSQLEVIEKEENGYPVLEVHIYAAQTKLTLTVEYDFTVGDNGNYVDISQNVDLTRLTTTLAQGERFFNYYPFSEKLINGSYAAFDSNGRPFLSWSYTTDGSNYIPIEATTRVPVGAKKITVRGSLDESKSIAVVFYDHNGNFLRNSGSTYNYGHSVALLNSTDLGIQTHIDEWGTFVGWSFERDHQSGNPAVIFDVYNYNATNGSNPNLQLVDHIDTVSLQYAIDIDRYAVHNSNLNYTLNLYAVYATDYATIKYNTLKSIVNGVLNDHTQIKLPIYSNDDYLNTKIGGRTVGYDSDAFTEYGLAVLDDNNLTMADSRNFIGWEIDANSFNGVNEDTKSQFINQIWFPGEYLPSIDFDFTINPIRLPHSNQVQEYTVGNRTYRVLSLALSSLINGYEFNGSVDIVALPRGNYTIETGGLVINSDREVRIIVPADSGSQIVLKPRAIQCNTIKEFYVGDNLTVTGSPVIGDAFEAYRVKKGYRAIENNMITGVLDASTKYNFAASVSGLLVTPSHTLLGVPSHTTLTTQTLLDLLNNQAITRIASYALSNINNLDVINLAKNTNLQIDAKAIYDVNARQIILPASTENDDSLQIDAQALSGKLSNLSSVTFGNTTNTTTWYAFTDNGFVYYIDSLANPNTKTHIMYALQTVHSHLNNLTYTNNNLPIENTVTKIEPCALMGLNWNSIKSVTAENDSVDLTVLLGIPNHIPLFTTATNPHKGPMIQPYMKTFRFTYKEGQTVSETFDVEYAYGQTFRVFDAQNNNYCNFNRPWFQFVAWKFNGKLFRIGEIYKVGIDDAVIGDKYVLQFDASSTSSWRAYPVQFITYQDTYTASQFVFTDAEQKQYQMTDLFNSNNLGDIYLPGLDQKITLGSAVYQFIGWTTKTMKINSTTPNLWNSVEPELRILPNYTAQSTLCSGVANSQGVYVYYALYEKVTPEIEYVLLGNNTFAANGITNTNVNSLNIPFANYYNGRMVPITKINSSAFNDITNIDHTPYTDIAIGGAVSEIGDYAFSGVKSDQITFAHKGRDIYYNYNEQGTPHQLKIGNFAFANNTVISRLVLPVATESLGNGAFQSCTSLYRVAFEEGALPYLRRLGNEVFKGNKVMRNNEIVSLLMNDQANNRRFTSVGDGIFMNTAVEGENNKIVWIDTLLHVYYTSGSNFTMEFNEKIIAGYAFANFGSDVDSSVKITIKFTNPDVQVKAKAFSELHRSIDKINMKSVDITKVDINAFDNTIKHSVMVSVDNDRIWNQKFAELRQKAPNITFTIY